MTTKLKVSKRALDAYKKMATYFQNADVDYDLSRGNGYDFGEVRFTSQELPTQKMPAMSLKFYFDKLPCGYPNIFGHKKLVSSIEHILNKRCGFSFDNKNNILITHGATGGYTLLLQLFTDSNEEIYIPYPYYTGHKTSAFMVGNKVSHKLNNQRFGIITSPNNPTGQYIPLEKIKSLSDKLDVLVIDITYLPLNIGDNFNYGKRLFDLIKERNLVVLGSLSKVLSANFRLGFVYFPNGFDKEIKKGLLGLIPSTTVGESMQLQETVSDLLIYNYSLLFQRRDYSDIVQKFKEIFGDCVVGGEGAPYLVVKCKTIDDAKKLYEIMKKNGVLTVVYADDTPEPGYPAVRFSLFDKDAVNRALNKIKQSWNEFNL